MLSTEQLLKQYTIRVSGRAKYVRLTISLEKGIVVVVPKSMSQRRMAKIIPQFVKDKQRWLSDAIEKLQLKGQFRAAIKPCKLPEKISLPALGQVFSIHYISSSDGLLQAAKGTLSKAEDSSLQAEGSLLKTTEGSLLQTAEGSLTLHHQEDYKLEIRGNWEENKQVFALLEMFFKDYARFYLKQRLDQLSGEARLPYNRLTVRAQKTRWGSCSSKKNINLNYRLIFIEKKLMDYILLHELAHTKYMNHAQDFWHLLETLMPGARSLDRLINQAAKDLDCWIFHQ